MKHGGTVLILVAAFAVGASNITSAEPQLPIKGSYKLPLQGSYGNESGCNALKEREPVSDDMQYLTSEEYKGWESSCSFLAAYEGWIHTDDRAWTVIASCSAEGVAYSELMTIHEQKDVDGNLTVTVTNQQSATADNEPVQLKLCK